MSGTALRVLLVEHERFDVELNLAELARAGYEVTADVAETPEQFAELIAKSSYDVVIADHRLPQWTGMDALDMLRKRGLAVPLILVTGTLGEERAVDCVKQGAVDYVLKGNLSRLPMAVARALEEARLRREQSESEALIRKLQLAVDQSPAAIFITDTAGSIEYVNARFCEVTGYSPEQVLGQNPRLLQSGNTPPETYRSLWSEIGEGRVWHGEIQNRRRNGELYWDAVTISPIRDAQGNVIQYLAIQEDITERKQTEEELREREQRFRQLAENISEVFFIMASDYSETLYINPAYERIWGRSCESVYRNPVSFLEQVAPEDRDRMRDNIARLRAGETTGQVELRIVRPNGSSSWVLTHAVPIRNEQGEVYRISGVALDITERKHAEDALRRSERRLRTLFETVNLIVLWLDVEGRVEYVNPFLLRLTGYASEEVIGVSWFERFIPESERIPLHGVFTELLTQELHPHHQNRILTKAGAARIIAWHNTVVYDSAGKPAGTLSIGEDVTELAQLEAQYRQAQKMEAVGRLAGGVAHDFNNLLTVILSYAQMLRDDLSPEDPKQEDLASILQAGEAAARLTRQLLAFSRQEVIQPRVIPLEEAVTGAEKLLRRVIGEDIVLGTRLSPIPLSVMIDPGQLEQVILNLAVNARDAMPDGGKLTIETEAVSFDDDYARTHWPASPGQFALLAMSDTGIGMDEATRARLFEPFFTTKEPGKGTGLGLATVYGILKQSGGFIWVYSEPGHGTTMKVYLPRVEAAASPSEPEPVEMGRGSEIVLLAEDAAAVRTVARQTLERYGYTVLEAPDGQSALGIAAKRQGPIHLLLTDVVMPDMNGQELARRLRTFLPNCRVLFMSGYTADTISRLGVLESGIAYLQKPFTPESLARKVRGVLDAPRNS